MLVTATYLQRSLHAGHFGCCLICGCCFFCLSQLISSRCSASPFLFGMLMTVFIKDAKQQLEVSEIKLSQELCFNELLYADDTLLADVDSSVVEAYMQQVSVAGQMYGRSFNWKKFEAFPLNCTCFIADPTGMFLQQKYFWFTWGACFAQMEQMVQSSIDPSVLPGTLLTS
ncbi:unnamed protein product [Polarella glacialis]|uniref:Reverse transcriptase domain-containing protein n=1 Tax=Polarella glacialis TaxID=89957 RepID=A0A813LYP3_POLGL|nr:unnamed protein product [Polarella glacialis]